VAQRLHFGEAVMSARAPRSLFRRLRDARGANLIEAAILMPLMLLITFGVFDIGVMLYVYLALESGASQAARYGVTGQQGAGLTREQSIMRAMRDATPTLTIPDTAFQFKFLPSGQTVWQNGAGGPGDVTRVIINYTWSFYTPLVRPFFDDGQVQMRVETAMLNERRFQ
jgi:hypothetical protein